MKPCNKQYRFIFCCYNYGQLMENAGTFSKKHATATKQFLRVLFATLLRPVIVNQST